MPHLAELVKLHANDPFEIIAINSYDDEPTARDGVSKYGVTWPMAFQTKEAPITRQYRVGAFPTYIVLDAEGKVRARPGGGKQLDLVIEKLLAELQEQK